jgi:protein-L-isoaspartate(D-aspartate) O-methyltransferase
MNGNVDFDRARAEMVQYQLFDRGIRSPAVLAAMRDVPRHLFVPENYSRDAYSDGPLAIGEGQTISQPYVVGLMTELLGLAGGEKVLEVGTGSGYQAAVLARMAASVYTIERHPSLADRARKALAAVGADNVQVIVGDGSRGLPEFAPYNAIVITAAAPEVPRTLLGQLADGGRLVLPVGGKRGQRLQLIRRVGDRFSRKKLAPVAFVPLRGQHGWSEETWT